MFGKTVKLYAVLICILVLGWPKQAFAEDSSMREYQIKAAYIYNFIKFIDWPADSQQRQSTRICVLGSHPFAKYLDSLEKNKAKGKSIEIIHASSDAALSDCNILYILKDTADFEQILAKWSPSPILTVGESSSFLSNGGIINLALVANKIQVHINQKHAREIGFRISGNLLEIATVVQ